MGTIREPFWLKGPLRGRGSPKGDPIEYPVMCENIFNFLILGHNVRTHFYWVTMCKHIFLVDQLKNSHIVIEILIYNNNYLT